LTLLGRISLALAALLFVSIHAQAEPRDELDADERAHYAAICRIATFEDGFLSIEDLNYDRRDDAIVDTAKAICDGTKGPDCTILGCPYRIYALDATGRFKLAAEVRAFGFETRFRYGVKIIDFRIAGTDCGKAVAAPCHMIGRLRGHHLEIISRQ
jgi:hypothetical protein